MLPSHSLLTGDEQYCDQHRCLGAKFMVINLLLSAIFFGSFGAASFEPLVDWFTDSFV